MMMEKHTRHYFHFLDAFQGLGSFTRFNPNHLDLILFH